MVMEMPPLGACVGEPVGTEVGFVVGSSVGTAVETDVGFVVGSRVGTLIVIGISVGD